MTFTHSNNLLISEILCQTQRLPWRLNCKEFTCNAGDVGVIPGSGRSPGVGNGNPLR